MAGVYFFLMPDEFIDILKRASARYDLWLAMAARPATKFRMATPESVTSDLLTGPFDGVVTLQIGFRELSPGPVATRTYASGNDQGFDIDYEKSYNIRFKPSILTPDRKILFQGTMLMLAQSRYPDAAKGKRLTAIFQTLRREIRKRCDLNLAMFAETHDGRIVPYNWIVAGKCVPLDGSIDFKSSIAQTKSWRFGKRK